MCVLALESFLCSSGLWYLSWPSLFPNFFIYGSVVCDHEITERLLSLDQFGKARNFPGSEMLALGSWYILFISINCALLQRSSFVGISLII